MLNQHENVKAYMNACLCRIQNWPLRQLSVYEIFGSFAIGN